MNFSIIQKSQLEGAHRLDAEYYKPQTLKIIKKIRKIGISKLGNIVTILRGKTPSYSETGYSVIRSGDLSWSWFINDELLFSKEGNLFWLKKGDVLVSSIGKGSIGKINLFNLEKRCATVSEVNILRNIQVDPYVLLFFLRSKYGQSQIKREITGATGQLHLNKENLANIEVPISVLKNDFKKLFQKAWSNFQQSKSLYSQAENLLLEELGLKDFKFEDDLAYIVNSSKVKSASRADAEYFQPKYKKLISKIKSKKTKPLLEAVENVEAKFDPKSNPEKSFRYVELANIGSNIGVIDGFSEILGQDASSRARRMLKSGDVIVSSVEGSFGKVALVDKEQDGYLASTGFFQFRQNS